MTARRLWRYAAKLGLLLGLAALVIPDAGVHTTSISLTRVQTAKSVDFADGVVWILALGSDARPGTDLEDGRTDAIQLIGLDLESGRAAGLGIPRDSLLPIPGDGLDRINTAMSEGGTDLTAEMVAELTGIQPDYVFLAGFEGLPRHGRHDRRRRRRLRRGVHRRGVRPRRGEGVNQFDGLQALDYARTRAPPRTPTSAGSANQQQMMLGILRHLRANEDDPGFIERGTLSALRPQHRSRADGALPAGRRRSRWSARTGSSSVC